MLTYLVIAGFIFFGIVILKTKDAILVGLKAGLKKRKKAENDCCGGNCHCDEK